MSILKSTNSGAHQPITPEKLKELGYYIFWSSPSGTTVYIKRGIPAMQITHHAEDPWHDEFFEFHYTTSTTVFEERFGKYRKLKSLYDLIEIENVLIQFYKNELKCLYYQQRNEVMTIINGEMK